MTNSNIKLHIGLHVSDVAKSQQFYHDLFGQAPIKTKSDYAKFETDQVVLSLIQHPSQVKSGFGHMGLRYPTTAEVNQQYDRLQQLNYDLRKEEQVACCYALQDKFWIQDPDGHEWEMYTFLEDVEKPSLKVEATQEATACCAPSCCS